MKLKKTAAICLTALTSLFIFTFSTAAESFIIGDADSNGILDAGDAAIILQKVLDADYKMPLESNTDDYLAYVDVTADGILDASDAASVLQKVLNGDYLMPAEYEEPVSINLDMNELEVGEYTEDLDFGNIVITASAEYPVYVCEIVVYNTPFDEVVSGDSIEIIGDNFSIEKHIKLTDHNDIYVKTNKYYKASVELIYMDMNFGNEAKKYCVTAPDMINAETLDRWESVYRYGDYDTESYYYIDGAYYYDLDKNSTYVINPEDIGREYLIYYLSFNDLD